MKKRIIAVYFSLILCALSCKNTLDIKKIKYAEYYIEGNIKVSNNDTIFEGPISYYNKSGNLISVVNYKNNEIHGNALDYYENGRLKQESQYFYGDKNGINQIYDSTGKVISQINYFHGLVVGPQTTFRNDSVYLYKFMNFENWELYSCEYEKNQALERGSLLNYVTHYIEVDGVKKMELFIYLINPPHKRITYEIYDKNLKLNDSILVKTLSYADGFFQKTQLNIPSKNHKYFFKVKAFYPDEKVTVEDILKENEKELKLPNVSSK